MQLRVPLFLVLVTLGAALAGRFNLLDNVKHEVIRVKQVHLEGEITPSEHRILASYAHPREEEFHPTHTSFTFQAMGKDFELVLRKNHFLLSPEYKEYRVGDNGERTVKNRDQVLNCYYHGYVKGDPSSAVAVSTCRGLRGQIHAYEQVYTIEPKALHTEEFHNLKQGADGRWNIQANDADHIFYVSSHVDMGPGPFTCGVDDINMGAALREREMKTGVPSHGMHDHDHDHDDHDHNQHSHSFSSADHIGMYDAHHHDFSQELIFKNRILRNGLQAGGTLQFIELFAANDYPRFAALGSHTETDAGDHYNVVDLYYSSSTNMANNKGKVLLIGQTTFLTQASTLPTTPSGTEIVTIDYLQTWSDYQYNAGNQYPSHDNAQLLSYNDFQGSTIGLAYTWQICNPAASASVVQTTYTLAFDSATMAHELGHNLGMCHDPPATRPSGNPGCATLSTTDCTNFIMSSSSNPNAVNTRFSLCSATDFDDYVANRAPIPSCLAQPVVIRSWYNTSVCGNGFRELNEACDCGNQTSCVNAPPPFTDTCCNATSCSLLNGKQCSNSQACCANCLLKPNTVVCRAAKDECDIAEMCTGTSGDCPDDKTIAGCTPAENPPFYKKYWFEIVLGVSGFVAAILAWKCLRACWDCMGCGEGVSKEDNARRSFRRSQSLRRSRRGRSALQMKQMGSPNKPQNVSKTIALPPNWAVEYSADGFPIYYNRVTGERYDFRTQHV